MIELDSKTVGMFIEMGRHLTEDLEDSDQKTKKIFGCDANERTETTRTLPKRTGETP